MATSLLRLGRMRPLKCLQLQSWGVLRSHSVASFCTRAEDPAKPAKKTKAASKTAEAPDERANLLAYKTAVAFPVRLSQLGIFLAQSVGVAEPVASSGATAETIAAAAGTVSTSDDAVAAIRTSSKPGDPAADGSSSSSSDSDSDSDSDFEDDKSEVKAEIKTSPPDLSKLTAKEEAEVQEVTSKVKEAKYENKKEDTPLCASDAAPESASAAAVATIDTIGTSVSSAELVASAPKICAAIDVPEVSSFKGLANAASSTVPDAQTQTPAKVVTEPATPEKAASDVPIGTTCPASAEVSAEADTAEVTAETATEVSALVEIAEEMVDHAPVVADYAGEKLQAETGVEEATAAPPPEPEEPFDNSTYKNYQHHSYTPYTFVEQDVEMAKFRLPQPTSGRPSPRH